ncbi:hypothetical protein A3J41_00470 [candidate division TM6 bacterium RIFCSPHIGHO2_12_FULL_38_8]|nr:MAG: hypothetical protein A3J41_00470 [candidate division TM6 bacterium RIFCSPHIGHO2_12_FULL_38_8]
MLNSSSSDERSSSRSSSNSDRRSSSSEKTSSQSSTIAQVKAAVDTKATTYAETHTATQVEAQTRRKEESSYASYARTKADDEEYEERREAQRKREQEERKKRDDDEADQRDWEEREARARQLRPMLQTQVITTDQLRITKENKSVHHATVGVMTDVEKIRTQAKSNNEFKNVQQEQAIPTTLVTTDLTSRSDFTTEKTSSKEQVAEAESNTLKIFIPSREFYEKTDKKYVAAHQALTSAKIAEISHAEIMFAQSFKNYCETKYTQAELIQKSHEECLDEFCKVIDEKLTAEYQKKIRKFIYLSMLQRTILEDFPNHSMPTKSMPNTIQTNAMLSGIPPVILGGSCGGAGGAITPAITASMNIIWKIQQGGGGGGKDDDKDKDKKEKEKKKQEEDFIKAVAKYANEIAFKNGTCTQWADGQKIDLSPVDPRLKYNHGPLQRLVDISTPIPGSNDRFTIVDGKIIKFTKCDMLGYGLSNAILKAISHRSDLYQAPGQAAYKASVIEDLSMLSKAEIESLRDHWGFDFKQKEKEKNQDNPNHNKNSDGPDKDPNDDKGKTKKAAAAAAAKKAKDELDRASQNKYTNGKGVHESNPKHHQNAQVGIAKEPARPIEALKDSLFVDENTRVAIQDGEIVIFRKHGTTADGFPIYHSYIEENIHRVKDAKQVLSDAGLIHPKNGKVLKK